MSDPIRPSLAARPDELCGLIADALGDGDLEAALSYYEDGIVQEIAGRRQVGITAVREALALVIDARLAFRIQVVEQLTGADLAMMGGWWSLSGNQADGTPQTSRGTFRSVARLQVTGGWRLAIEHLTIDGQSTLPD